MAEYTQDFVSRINQDAVQLRATIRGRNASPIPAKDLAFTKLRDPTIVGVRRHFWECVIAIMQEYYWNIGLAATTGQLPRNDDRVVVRALRELSIHVAELTATQLTDGQLDKAAVIAAIEDKDFLAWFQNTTMESSVDLPYDRTKALKIALWIFLEGAAENAHKSQEPHASYREMEDMRITIQSVVEGPWADYENQIDAPDQGGASR